jgi:lathosterol oxidase
MSPLVQVVHVVLPLSLVAVGIVTGGALWAQAFAELFVCIAGSLLVSMGAAEALFAAVGDACQPLKTASKPRAAEALETVRAAFVFSALAAWCRWRIKLGKPTALVFSLAEAQPEAPTALWLYVVKLLLVTLLVDGYMYVKHRALHSRPLWPFHRDHHAFVNPSPFAAFAVAPVEALLTFAPVLLLCLPAAPVWAHAYGVWTAAFVLLNLYLHAGYTIRPLEALLRPLCINSSAFHNMHHEKTVRNFGELLTVWDHLLGTGAHPK